MAQVNNHVHSTYSFSPHDPEDIPLRAQEEGLLAVGLMDHDSVGGADRFLKAAARLGVASTVGCEVRADFTSTPFGDRRVNNPDTEGNIYMSFHGIPAGGLAATDRFLAPIREARGVRNRRQLDLLNGILSNAGVSTLDYDRDVLPLSRASEGGGVTERHLLYALALSLIDQFGPGAALVGAVKERLGVDVAGVLRERLLDINNPHYAYDLLGLFKATLVPRFFVQPNQSECADVRDAIAVCESVGAIAAYPYLGDVGESPTGDKAAQEFEDAYLDDLFPVLKDLGFRAITYMPPRNTPAQLARIRDLCAEYGFMEISGVDINSSRQSFVTPILDQPEFNHLREATWALIAHEKLATVEPRMALFAPDNPWAGEPLPERITRYGAWGERLDHHDPVSSAQSIINEVLS